MSLADFNSIVKAITGKSIADFAKDQADGKSEDQVMAEVSATSSANIANRTSLGTVCRDICQKGIVWPVP